MRDQYSRREFLATLARLSALPAMAMLFGCDVGVLRSTGASRTAIVYGTRYGATRDTAGWIGEGMGGSVDLLAVDEASVSGVRQRYDYLVVGSGV